MTKKLSKSLLAICLAFSFIFLVATPAKAEKVGDIKTEYKTLTLNEVNDVCLRLQNALNYKDGSYAVGIITDILQIPVISNIYSGAFALIKGDIQKDYNFYDGIRTKMIKNKYSKVKIAYKSEYSEWRVGNDITYAWKFKSKSVTKYYK